MFSLNTIKVNYIAFCMTLECYLSSPGVQDSLFLPISSVVSAWLVKKDISFLSADCSHQIAVEI